ncbi:hypothetical protein pb186bvf_017298 [Paramecium bursaria]
MALKLSLYEIKNKITSILILKIKMIDAQNFQFNNIITIQPFILQQHLKVRASYQCLQIIGKYLNSTLNCEPDHITRILKYSRNQLFNDTKEGIINRFYSLVDKADYESNLRDSEIDSIIKWIIYDDKYQLKQKFIYLIDIVQILIDNLGQHEVNYSNFWIKDLLIDSPSYTLLQDLFKHQLQKKVRKSLMYRLILDDKHEFIQDKSLRQSQSEKQSKEKQIQQSQHRQEIDSLHQTISKLRIENDNLLHENVDLHEQIFDYKHQLRESKHDCDALEEELNLLKEQMQKASKNIDDNEKMNGQGVQQFNKSRIGRLYVQGQQPERGDSQKNKSLKRQPQLPIKNSPMKITNSKRVGLYEQTLIGLVDKKKSGQ